MLADKTLFLTGELYNWDDIVRAGLMSVNRKKYTVVNDISFAGGKIPQMRTPFVASNLLDGECPDVLVIGGGVVGCAIARELSKYKLDIILVEKEHDVALHASGHNDGMIHHCLTLRKGLLKKKYNDEGLHLYPAICDVLGVPFQNTGQYLCYTKKWTKLAAIVSLLYWRCLGISVYYTNRKKLAEKEPNLSKAVKFALFFPAAGVVSPQSLTIAYAENAADNGVKICLDTAVTDIEVYNDSIRSVFTNKGRVFPKLVINAAGVFAEDIARFAQDRFFSIHPTCGTNMIFDKRTSFLVKSIVSLFEENKTSSSVMRTVDNNLRVGPDSVETYERENFSTNQGSIKTVMKKQCNSVYGLCERDIITYFTGIRAVTYEDDFIISFGRKTKNIIHAAGIQSPGLTAAPAIALDISRMAAEFLEAETNEKFNPIHRGIIRAAALSDEERDNLIKKEPEYGEIVCCCEEISKGEVLAALRRSVPCDTVDGVKRRVRSGMGRCQGGYCSPQILQIIAKEMKIPLTSVKQMSYNSRILFGENKDDIYDNYGL